MSIEQERREKRAQSISAMGLVNRDGDKFIVSTPSLRGRQTSYQVWRDKLGKVRCNCLEFEEYYTSDAEFRCEHILAVKFSLLAKTNQVSSTQTINSVTEANSENKPIELPSTVSNNYKLNNLPNGKYAPYPGRNNHVAISLMDLVTAKQLGMIRSISRELGIDADEECQSVMDCKTDELGKRSASWFIQHLQELQTKTPVKTVF